jgi:hypothetical protein
MLVDALCRTKALAYLTRVSVEKLDIISLLIGTVNEVNEKNYQCLLLVSRDVESIQSAHPTQL